MAYGHHHTGKMGGHGRAHLKSKGGKDHMKGPSHNVGPHRVGEGLGHGYSPPEEYGGGGEGDCPATEANVESED